MLTAHIASEDLQRCLNDLKKYNQQVQNGARKVISETAYRVANDAKRNLTKNRSVVTGALRSSIKVISNLAKFEAKTGTSIKYAPFVEYGTVAHVITARRAKVLARYNRTSKGKAQFTVFGRTVNHPGTRPKPFLFPAAESNRRQFESSMINVLKNSV